MSARTHIGTCYNTPDILFFHQPIDTHIFKDTPGQYPEAKDGGCLVGKGKISFSIKDLAASLKEYKEMPRE